MAAVSVMIDAWHYILNSLPIAIKALISLSIVCFIIPVIFQVINNIRS